MLTPFQGSAVVHQTRLALIRNHVTADVGAYACSNRYGTPDGERGEVEMGRLYGCIALHSALAVTTRGGGLSLLLLRQRLKVLCLFYFTCVHKCVRFRLRFQLHICFIFCILFLTFYRSQMLFPFGARCRRHCGMFTPQSMLA